MKTLIKYFIVLAIMSFAHVSYGQASIESIVPIEGIQGQSIQIVIKGDGTSFAIGGVSVDLGSGILITQIDVRNSITLYVSAVIQNTAFPGPRDLRITSNGETIELLNAFEVIDKGANDVFAILEINPVQVLYASDFDPDNLASAPVIFRVTVMNDQQTRDLRTIFYLILEGEGLVLTAEKQHGEVPASASLTFDNREFDEFDINEDNSAVASQIMATGMLPPGIYTYLIEVRQGNQVLASAQGQNTLLNQAGDLIIISPGSPFDGSEPDVQMAAQPLFQWISSANQYDLFLYEVSEGQTNAQEIVQQLPVFREFSIPGNSFLYPLSAEPLEEGVTYAWQLRAYYNNPTGNAFFDSPLYWFTYDAGSNTVLPIASIEIVPDYLEIDTGEPFQFDAIVKDLEGNILEVKPTWSVLPDESFGTIDTTGIFVAGPNPRVGAVEVSYGTYSTHCVIMLEFSGFYFNILETLFDNATRRVHQPDTAQ